MYTSRNKLIIGDQVKTIDELLSCEFICLEGKIYHKGWFCSWQLHFTDHMIKSGKIRKIVRDCDSF